MRLASLVLSVRNFSKDKTFLFDDFVTFAAKILCYAVKEYIPSNSIASAASV